METAVQIFQIKEAEELSVPEITEQWKAMVQDLGLEGQKALLERDATEVCESPVPYVFLNRRMEKVLETICPKQVKLNEYSKMPIPLEILGHVKQCELKGWFVRIEVWSDEKEPDPVVVGIRKEGREELSYLIGRWGAEAMDLAQLELKAVQRIVADKKAKAIQKIRDLQEAIEERAILGHVEKILEGDYTPLNYL